MYAEALGKKYPPELYQKIQPHLCLIHQNSNIIQNVFQDIDSQFRSKTRDFSDTFNIIQQSEWGHDFYFDQENYSLTYIPDSKSQHFKSIHLRSQCRCSSAYHTHVTDRDSYFSGVYAFLVLFGPTSKRSNCQRLSKYLCRYIISYLSYQTYCVIPTGTLQNTRRLIKMECEMGRCAQHFRFLKYLQGKKKLLPKHLYQAITEILMYITDARASSHNHVLYFANHLANVDKLK